MSHHMLYCSHPTHLFTPTKINFTPNASASHHLLYCSHPTHIHSHQLHFTLSVLVTTSRSRTPECRHGVGLKSFDGGSDYGDDDSDSHRGSRGRKTGLGMSFKSNHTGMIIVRHIKEGGPAERLRVSGEWSPAGRPGCLWVSASTFVGMVDGRRIINRPRCVPPGFRRLDVC